MKTWASCLRKPMSFCVLADYHDLFILLVVCPGHLLTETKPQVNWTFHHIQWPALYFLYFYKKLLHKETNCWVLGTSGSSRAEIQVFIHLNLRCKVLWVTHTCTQSSDHKAHQKLLSGNSHSQSYNTHRVILVSCNHLEDRKVPTQMKVKRCGLNWIDVCRCYPDSLSHR